VINIKRVRNLKKGREIEGHVLYWMSRDQRVFDNWALAYAIELAENKEQSVVVVFALSGNYLGATWRQYDFMLKGLKKVEGQLCRLNIPFYVLIGDPSETLPFFIRQHRAARLVMDFDPLKIKQNWKKQILAQVEIPVDEVDAHNIIPCWIVSDKAEFGAHTIRPKITRLLPEFLDEYPPLIRQVESFHPHRINWEVVSISVKADHSVRPVEWLTPGEDGANAVLKQFLDQKLENYAEKRNDPNEKFTSGLSPFLHFGHISAQRIALEITRNIPGDRNTDAFLEELIIRKELSDNFCYYNPDYDHMEGILPWARNTLDNHREDEREYIYSADEFEEARTHDTLWNAAQQQMTLTGTMHGYLRMYWAKKFLEWSESPEEALATALYLNDKYQLDGRDPNGYAGCSWSIGGIHDRAWGERNVFGKIRYMNRNGCQRKFNVDQYIERFSRRQLSLGGL
jgi:deoxyribodipyrimidine photo-lyase